MSIKKIMHKDRHGAQVSVEFGEGGAASQLVEQFLGGMGVPAMQEIPREHPGGPKGTDTVPAWLTPGEFVMNAEATRMFEPQIEEMNNAGRAVQRQQGGSIPEYKADGGGVGEDDLVMQALKLGVTPEDLRQLLKNQSPQYQDATRVTRNIPVGEDMTADLTGTGYRNLLERTEGSGPVSALVQGGLDVGNNISAGLKRAGTYLGGTNVPLSDATLAVDNRPLPPSVRGDNLTEDEFLAKIPGSQAVIDGLSTVPGYASSMFKALMPAPPSPATLAVDAANKPKTGYDPVAAREEQARLEAANRIARAEAEEKYNRENLESRGKGYAGTLGMFGLEVPPENEDIEAQITAIDKQRVLGEIPDTIATARIKALRDKETVNQIARETAAAGEQKKVVDQVSELERQAKLLEDAGYVEDANALREEAAGLTSGTFGPQVEPEDDDTTISGLIDAGNKAKEVETPEGEVVDGETKEPSAWDKVKGFFKEGFGTILDKGALSEAATLYLGSRALGYGHEGSLNFVAKRYGKGIEDKLAIANKAVGKYTNDSITKYKDTGNLNDLALIPKLTDQGKPAYFVDPKTGTTYDLRTAKDEKGVVRYLDQEDKVVDTKSMLTSEQYNLRSKTDKDRIRSLIVGMKKTMSAKATAAGTENYDPDAFVNTEEVAEAMAQYSMKFNANTSRTAELTKYVVDGIIKHRSNPNMKDISDRDLTEIMLNKGVVSRVTKDVLKAEEGASATAPAVQSAILDKAFPDIDALDGPVSKGEFLKVLYQFGYNSLTPDDKKRYVKDSGGTHNGFLEYIKQGQAARDQDKWVPAFKSLSENLVKQ